MISKVGIISRRQLLEFWILRWYTLERLFCLTSAGLERIKHGKVVKNAVQEE